jgi:hypothetical protein
MRSHENKAWLAVARADFHRECLESVITQSAGIPSIADSDNEASRVISLQLMNRIGPSRSVPKKPPGQTSGKMFELACEAFLKKSLERLTHVRPGKLEILRGTLISNFEQYRHLSDLEALAGQNRELKTLLGSDYLIKPDIIVRRPPEQDQFLNLNENLVDASIARLTGLREINGARDSMHASISCKLTMRSDRAQNTRSEALNLVRNRKGRLPHIVAVTAEPLPSRIASLALGTGDLDCVYHFALPELVEAVRLKRPDYDELLDTMIVGKRLRDIADLPLDLVI